VKVYRVIRKSLRDFRPLRYSNRDSHAEGEHVNRGSETPSFCPTLQVLDMSLSAVSVLVIAQPISEVPEGLMNNPVYMYSVGTAPLVINLDTKWNWVVKFMHRLLYNRK